MFKLRFHRLTNAIDYEVDVVVAHQWRGWQAEAGLEQALAHTIDIGICPYKLAAYA